MATLAGSAMRLVTANWTASRRSVCIPPRPQPLSPRFRWRFPKPELPRKLHCRCCPDKAGRGRGRGRGATLREA